MSMSVRDNASGIVPVAEVLIDSVGLSKVFSYSIPDRYLSRIGIGSYVSVQLGNSRSKGWVVGLCELSALEREGLEFKLSPIFRLLGGGPTAEVVALCRWASWRFVGSPVNFLTHASPKKRVPSRSGGELDFRDCDMQFRESRGESRVVRIPPSHSRADWIISHLGAPSSVTSQVIIVCATQTAVKHLATRFIEYGYSVAVFPDEFERAIDGAQVIIGARNAVFASVSNLAEVIVVDADDPSHTETSSPSWSSYVVARARVGQSQRVVLLSSAPSVDMTYGAKTMSLSRSKERSGWPKVMVGEISEVPGRNPLISSALISQIKSGVGIGVAAPAVTDQGLIDYDGVIILYNRLGGARTLICSKCGKVVSCVKCSTTLMQAVPKYLRVSRGVRREIHQSTRERLSIASLTCPRCKEEYPAICTHCLSTSLKVVTFGIERFRSLLEAAAGKVVSEIDASTDVHPESLGPITIGTEAVFSRFQSARMIVIADFDHYLYAPALDASETAISLLTRAARLVPPRSIDTGYVPMYIQTRDTQNSVIKAAVEGDPRQVTAGEAALRKKLSLPPFGAIVRVFGPKAPVWIQRSGIGGDDGVEVIPVGDGVFDLRGNSISQLLDLIAGKRSVQPSNGVRFSANPS